jgi:hypothetical protein
MNQIAIGDSSGMTVIHGELISAGYRRATCFFNFDPQPEVSERIEIEIAGTPSQIQGILDTFNRIILRADLYEGGLYASPQYLRFQGAHGDTTYRTPIRHLRLSVNKDGYLTARKGSLLLTLHYTRPPWFDQGLYALPLSTRSSTDVLTGVTLANHCDAGTADFNSAYAKGSAIATSLPAPLKLEIEFLTAASTLKDLFVGVYHNQGDDRGESHFYYHASDFSGGTPIYNAGAINAFYRTLSWSSDAWTSLATVPISDAAMEKLDYKAYRPILHLFNNHAYSDLYFRLGLLDGADLIYQTDPVYADPNYGYVLFPPINLPLHQTLRDLDPKGLTLAIYGHKDSTSTYAIAFDQLTLLPLDYAMQFKGFFSMTQGDVFVYDQATGLCNVRATPGPKEIKQHIPLGGSLMLFPNRTSRLILMWTNNADKVAIDDSVKLIAYYRKRTNIL